MTNKHWVRWVVVMTTIVAVTRIYESYYPKRMLTTTTMTTTKTNPYNIGLRRLPNEQGKVHNHTDYHHHNHTTESKFENTTESLSSPSSPSPSLLLLNKHNDSKELKQQPFDSSNSRNNSNSINNSNSDINSNSNSNNINNSKNEINSNNSNSEINSNSSSNSNGINNSNSEINSNSNSSSNNNINSNSSSNSSNYKSIHLIGERHTGTKWIWGHLHECFGHELEVKKRFTRFKHWFQFNDTTLEVSPHHGRLVVAMVRNVYDWIDSLNKMPYHAPFHVEEYYNHEGKYRRRPLPWRQFLTTPWTMRDPPRLAHDAILAQQLATGEIADMRDIFCRDNENNWTWIEVNPCSVQDLKEWDRNATTMGVPPLYENNHDLSGDVYASVLDLRADKMVHFFTELPHYHGVTHFVPIRYEDMVAQGTAQLIREIEKHTGVSAQCDIYGPQTRNNNNNNNNNNKTDQVVVHKREYIQYLNKHVDWDAEALMGYQIMDVNHLEGGFTNDNAGI